MGSKRSLHGQGKVQLPTEMLSDEGSHGESARVKEDPGALGSTPGECEKAGTERGWSEMGHSGWGEQSHVENPRSHGGVPGREKKPTGYEGAL